MSIIGNAVTFGGGEPDLLWTNPSPNVAFAAQTVTVSANYDAYIVEVLWYTSYTGSGEPYRQTLVPNPLIQDQYDRFCISGVFNVGSGGSGSYRQITSVENGTFNFGAGYKQGNYGWSSDNTYCIPTRIWGVKWTI